MNKQKGLAYLKGRKPNIIPLLFSMVMQIVKRKNRIILIHTSYCKLLATSNFSPNDNNKQWHSFFKKNHRQTKPVNKPKEIKDGIDLIKIPFLIGLLHSTHIIFWHLQRYICLLLYYYCASCLQWDNKSNAYQQQTMNIPVV